jgi:hypothetical protein
LHRHRISLAVSSFHNTAVSRAHPSAFSSEVLGFPGIETVSGPNYEVSEKE